MDVKEIKILDITSPKFPVHIEYNNDTRVLYVSVDGITVLRINKCDIINDLPPTIREDIKEDLKELKRLAEQNGEDF